MRFMKFLSAAAAASLLLCSVPFSSYADDAVQDTAESTDAAELTEDTTSNDTAPGEGTDASDPGESTDVTEPTEESTDTTEPAEDASEENTEPSDVPDDEPSEGNGEDKPDGPDSSDKVEDDKNGSDKKDEKDYSYRVTADGKAIICEVRTTKGTFTIPSKVTDNGADFKVSGVDNFAFGMCENLTTIYVPDTLCIEDTANAAFVTETSFMKFMDAELGDSVTLDDVLRYVAKKINYKYGKFTDDDLTDVYLKLKERLGDIDLTKANSTEAKIMMILRRIERLDLGPDLSNSFQLWISAITYDGLTLCGTPDNPMKQYAEARNFLGLNYVSKENFIIGDANGDGKVNIRDAAYIASSIAKGNDIEISENPGADYNQDGKVNVRDAAAIAKFLASSL